MKSSEWKLFLALIPGQILTTHKRDIHIPYAVMCKTVLTVIKHLVQIQANNNTYIVHSIILGSTAMLDSLI